MAVIIGVYKKLPVDCYQFQSILLFSKMTLFNNQISNSKMAYIQSGH